MLPPALLSSMKGRGWGEEVKVGSRCEEKDEMKGMKRMREKWLTQNLRPNGRVDARKSKNVRWGGI